MYIFNQNVPLKFQGNFCVAEISLYIEISDFMHPFIGKYEQMCSEACHVWAGKEELFDYNH